MGYGKLGNYLTTRQRVTVEGCATQKQMEEVQAIFEHLDAHGYDETSSRAFEFRFSMSGECLDVYWCEPEPDVMERYLVDQIWEKLGHDASAVSHSIVCLIRNDNEGEGE